MSVFGLQDTNWNQRSTAEYLERMDIIQKESPSWKFLDSAAASVIWRCLPKNVNDRRILKLPPLGTDTMKESKGKKWLKSVSTINEAHLKRQELWERKYKNSAEASDDNCKDPDDVCSDGGSEDEDVDVHDDTDNDANDLAGSCEEQTINLINNNIGDDLGNNGNDCGGRKRDDDSSDDELFECFSKPPVQQESDLSSPSKKLKLLDSIDSTCSQSPEETLNFKNSSFEQPQLTDVASPSSFLTELVDLPLPSTTLTESSLPFTELVDSPTTTMATSLTYVSLPIVLTTVSSVHVEAVVSTSTSTTVMSTEVLTTTGTVSCSTAEATNTVSLHTESGSTPPTSLTQTTLVASPSNDDISKSSCGLGITDAKSHFSVASSYGAPKMFDDITLDELKLNLWLIVYYNNDYYIGQVIKLNPEAKRPARVKSLKKPYGSQDNVPQEFEISKFWVW